MVMAINPKQSQLDGGLLVVDNLTLDVGVDNIAIGGGGGSSQPDRPIIVQPLGDTVPVKPDVVLPEDKPTRIFPPIDIIPPIIPQPDVLPPVNPYTDTTITQTQTVSYNVPAIPPASMDGVVIFSTVSSDRTYVKGTMRPIGSDLIVSTNTSNVLTVAVVFTGTAGVTFEPNHFNLSPLEQKNVVVNFDMVEFEKLAEGINEITTVIDVTPTSIVERPVTVTIPGVRLPQPYQPPNVPPPPPPRPPILQPIVLPPPEEPIQQPQLPPKEEVVPKPYFMGGGYDWTTQTLSGQGGGGGGNTNDSVNQI